MEMLGKLAKITIAVAEEVHSKAVCSTKYLPLWRSLPLLCAMLKGCLFSYPLKY